MSIGKPQLGKFSYFFVQQWLHKSLPRKIFIWHQSNGIRFAKESMATVVCSLEFGRVMAREVLNSIQFDRKFTHRELDWIYLAQTVLYQFPMAIWTYVNVYLFFRPSSFCICAHV